MSRSIFKPTNLLLKYILFITYHIHKYQKLILKIKPNNDSHDKLRSTDYLRIVHC